MNYRDLLTSPIPITIYTPSSRDALPKLSIPSEKRFREVDALRRSSVERSGLRPGTYRELGGETFGCVAAVYDDLVGDLINKLSGLDAVDLCNRLYEQHEVILGNILRIKDRSNQDIVAGSPEQSGRQIQEMWNSYTPLIESVRWLLEVVVKHCKAGGTQAGNAKFEYLVALAHAIYLWDSEWEHVYHGIVPHEVVVNEDFTIGTEPVPRTSRAWIAYHRALEPYRAREDRALLNQSMRPPQEGQSIEKIANLPEFRSLNQPLESERGYSMADWVAFTNGLTDSFGHTEYRRLTKVSKLARFMATEWQVPKDRFRNLLVDHGLSKETVADVDMDRLRPMEYGRRESRLLMRPVVVLEDFGRPICIYGVETIGVYVSLFSDRLISGRIGIPMKTGGPLRKAIGGIQTGLGDPFRDQIGKHCMSGGYQVRQEKDRIGGENLPQGSGFGPVDVFVVDRVHRRFVLAEAKDVADEGTVPKLIRAEFTDFQGALGKLNKQVAWFEDRLDALKAEYDISPQENYSVEGVIVISRPRIWMYTHLEPLPIVDDKSFFKILEAGERFQTTPVPL